MAGWLWGLHYELLWQAIPCQFPILLQLIPVLLEWRHAEQVQADSSSHCCDELCPQIQGTMAAHLQINAQALHRSDVTDLGYILPIYQTEPKWCELPLVLRIQSIRLGIGSSQ